MQFGIKIYHDATWNNKTVALVQIDGTIMSSNVADFVRDIKLVPNDHIVVEIRSAGGEVMQPSQLEQHFFLHARRLPQYAMATLPPQLL